MTSRYSGWLVSRGVTPANSELVNRLGRTLLMQAMEQRRATRVGSVSLKKFLPDGSQLIVSYDGHTPIITVAKPVNLDVTTDTQSTLWMPRGFVVYPSSASSTTGWGTPVIATDDPPFATANIAPGLGVDRWTAGGKLGEVFISRQFKAGYPRPFREITPAFYSAQESPALLIDRQTGRALGVGFVFKPPAITSWTGYRIEFDDFAIAGGEGGVARQSLFIAIKDASDYLLPVRGLYDAAARAARYVSSDLFPSGTTYINDHDLPLAQAGYIKAQARLAKDGVAAVAHETITTATTDIVSTLRTQCHLDDSTFIQAATSLELGIRSGATALDAMQRDQWLAYGVRQWTGDDPALPVVSWDGYPSWNWPYYLVLGTIDSGAWVDLDNYTVRVRGTDKKIFSKRVCANGRVLGTLPDWVLSAGVQTRVEGTTTIDRLIVLGFRLSDQPPYVAVGPGAFEPYVKTLRVYFVDIARRNNLVLLPAHAVIGLYDATTNPDGWHAAGTFDLYPAGFVGAGSYHSLTQPPQFKGDGTRAVWIGAAYDDGITFHTGAFAIEGTFDSIAEGATSVSKALVDLAARSEGGIVFSASGFCYGIDYLPQSLTVRFFYSCGATYEDLETTDQVLRWSGIGAGTGFSAPSDIKANTGFIDGFAFSAAWTLDPLRGAMVGLQQKVSGGHAAAWQQLYTMAGTPVVVTSIGDGISGSPPWQTDVSTFGNIVDIGIPVFARSGENLIAGFELSPNNTFLHSFFDSTVGDIATLTQTPGSGLRLFPVGAV